MAPETNGRTHEPSLRELTAELDGLRALIAARIDGVMAILNERNQLYKERDDARLAAVDAAVAAVKDQTRASFEASEKAIVKAEDAQKAYNAAHNDLARKMDEQNKATMPRSEAEGRFRGLEEKINDVRTAIATAGAGQSGGREWRDDSRATLALVISAVGLIVVIVLAVVTYLK